MSILNEQLEEQLKEVFSDMKRDVTLAVFTKQDDCESCADTLAFMQEIEALSDKIHLESLDLEGNKDRAEAYNVQMVPSIVLLNDQKEYLGIKFNGIPAGHEINSFIPAILEVSGTGEVLPEQFKIGRAHV